METLNPEFNGSSIIITRFVKRLYNTIPPKPRYKFTWDVSKVLHLISTLMPLDKLSVKLFTCKLTV